MVDRGGTRARLTRARRACRLQSRRRRCLTSYPAPNERNPHANGALSAGRFVQAPSGFLPTYDIVGLTYDVV
jgi:hypothetical protein